MNKKAVSPLIATVLLMAFAVALGAIVMTWGKNYVTDTTKLTEGDHRLTCAFDVAGEVVATAGKPEACFATGPGTLSFIFKNNAYEDFSDMKITIFDNGNEISSPTLQAGSVPINKGEIKKVITNNDEEFNPTGISQVIISPVIDTGDELLTCVDTIKPITNVKTVATVAEC